MRAQMQLMSRRLFHASRSVRAGEVAPEKLPPVSSVVRSTEYDAAIEQDPYPDRQYGANDDPWGYWGLDRDHHCKWEALGMLIAGFGVYLGVAAAVKKSDPESKNPLAPRELPFNNLSTELGK